MKDGGELANANRSYQVTDIATNLHWTWKFTFLKFIILNFKYEMTYSVIPVPTFSEVWSVFSFRCWRGFSRTTTDNGGTSTGSSTCRRISRHGTSFTFSASQTSCTTDSTSVVKKETGEVQFDRFNGSQLYYRPVSVAQLNALTITSIFFFFFWKKNIYIYIYIYITWHLI